MMVTKCTHLNKYKRVQSCAVVTKLYDSFKNAIFEVGNWLIISYWHMSIQLEIYINVV